MTSDKLYTLLKLLDRIDTQTEIQSTLEVVRDALVTLASAPAQPTHQSNLATALLNFHTSAAGLTGALTPAQEAEVQKMGGDGYFSPTIESTVRSWVQDNAMTPSVARDHVQDLANKRAAFLGTVRASIQSLGKLGIKENTLEPGAADISFLIPRDLFDNELGALSKELKFLDRLVRDVSEAATGSVQPVVLEQLSSSIPNVTVLADLAVVSVIGTIVNKFLDSWKKIEEIRHVRGLVAKLGGSKVAQDELEEQIETVVEEVVEESTQFVLSQYPATGNRKNELGNSIRQDAKRLFGQIERGLTVEVHAEPQKDSTEDQKKMIGEISQIRKTMAFPEVASNPMLLESGEVLEGEIKSAKHTKKTTSTTKTAKETKSDGKS
jgi:hypothetical protein